MKTWPKNKILFILYVYRRDWSWGPWGVCGMQSRALQIRKTVQKATKIHKNHYNWKPYTNGHSETILLKKPFAWCSLEEHSSEFAFSFWIILGALKARWASVFCASKIIKNEWLTVKYQHETWTTKKVLLAIEMTKMLDIPIQFYEISLYCYSFHKRIG